MKHGSDQLSNADVVASAVSITSLEEIERLAHVHYGIVAQARRLASERDENFHLTASSGEQFLLKISNAAEDPSVTDFQTQAFRHVQKLDPTLPIPHLVMTRSEEFLQPVFLAQELRSLRLLRYLPGTPLHEAARSARQTANLGSLLARLDLALQDFRHPADGYQLRWDLTHAATLRPWLDLLEDPDRRAMACECLDNFERYALPALPGLPWQVIHNDFQPSNVLVEPQDPDHVCGVIDFGDMVRAPRINDLAVAAAYHVASSGSPLGFAPDMVRAFNRICPLQEQEVEILFDLIATRLLLTVVITNWRVSLHPANRDYILRNAPAAWSGLERCAVIGRAQGCELLRQACSSE